MLTLCPFLNFFMTGTVLHTNEILQRCMHDLVLNKIVMIFAAKNLIKFVFIQQNYVINMRICEVLQIFFFVSVYRPWWHVKGHHSLSIHAKYEVFISDTSGGIKVDNMQTYRQDQNNHTPFIQSGNIKRKLSPSYRHTLYSKLD